ncbi:hypothetical protein U0070_017669 [Myodes glareolus]|uniref:Uncharacterized protein n=1 Tax=Myodes glareolus TaxID=447135 RepID=A0AAW0K5L4_MYOGA
MVYKSDEEHELLSTLVIATRVLSQNVLGQVSKDVHYQAVVTVAAGMVTLRLSGLLVTWLCLPDTQNSFCEGPCAVAGKHTNNSEMTETARKDPNLLSAIATKNDFSGSPKPQGQTAPHFNFGWAMERECKTDLYTAAYRLGRHRESTSPIDLCKGAMGRFPDPNALPPFSLNQVCCVERGDLPLDCLQAQISPFFLEDTVVVCGSVWLCSGRQIAPGMKMAMGFNCHHRLDALHRIQELSEDCLAVALEQGHGYQSCCVFLLLLNAYYLYKFIVSANLPRSSKIKAGRKERKDGETGEETKSGRVKESPKLPCSSVYHKLPLSRMSCIRVAIPIGIKELSCELIFLEGSLSWVTNGSLGNRNSCKKSCSHGTPSEQRNRDRRRCVAGICGDACGGREAWSAPNTIKYDASYSGASWTLVCTTQICSLNHGFCRLQSRAHRSTPQSSPSSPPSLHRKVWGPLSLGLALSWFLEQKRNGSCSSLSELCPRHFTWLKTLAELCASEHVGTLLWLFQDSSEEICVYTQGALAQLGKFHSQTTAREIRTNPHGMPSSTDPTPEKEQRPKVMTTGRQGGKPPVMGTPEGVGEDSGSRGIPCATEESTLQKTSWETSQLISSNLSRDSYSISCVVLGVPLQPSCHADSMALNSNVNPVNSVIGNIPKVWDRGLQGNTTALVHQNRPLPRMLSVTAFLTSLWEPPVLWSVKTLKSSYSVRPTSCICGEWVGMDHCTMSNIAVSVFQSATSNNSTVACINRNGAASISPTWQPLEVKVSSRPTSRICGGVTNVGTSPLSHPEHKEVQCFSLCLCSEQWAPPLTRFGKLKVYFFNPSNCEDSTKKASIMNVVHWDRSLPHGQPPPPPCPKSEWNNRAWVGERLPDTRKVSVRIQMMSKPREAYVCSSASRCSGVMSGTEAAVQLCFGRKWLPENQSRGLSSTEDLVWQAQGMKGRLAHQLAPGRAAKKLGFAGSDRVGSESFPGKPVM